MAHRAEQPRLSLVRQTRGVVIGGWRDDRRIQSAAPTLGVTVRPLGVQEPDDFEQAFAAMIQERPDALFVVADLLTRLQHKRVVEFAAQNRLPAIAGVAFAGDRGIKAVEVSVDGGKAWQTARVKPAMGNHTWVSWAFEWTPPTPGTATLQVRAIDGTSAVAARRAHTAAPRQG